MKKVLRCDEIGPCTLQDQYESISGHYLLHGTSCGYCGEDLSDFIDDEPIVDNRPANNNNAVLH